jgi:predicted transcriptional regulator YdeE
MQTIHLNSDINVACVRAKSFPEGVMSAHQQIHKLVAFDGSRRFFGISYGAGNGKIEYMAAAENLSGDQCFEDFEKYVIKKGAYLLVEIKNFRDDVMAIGQTFQKMINRPDIDQQGACIEWYPNLTDVHCMVRLAD